MAHYHRKADWHLPESMATPENLFFNRRAFLKTLGLGTVGAIGAANLGPWPALGANASKLDATYQGLRSLNAGHNPAYTVDRPPTPERIPARFNNFYEFSREKDDVWALANNLQTSPWKLVVTGMVPKTKVYDVDDLIKRMPLEERVYRFRCVEAWSMVVPWVGFPMSALIKEVQPLGGAKYVQMETFNRPDQAPRQGLSPVFGSAEPWPYTEGLSMAEAMNEMTLLTVGSYGHVLPKQHGAPIRLIVPWKYGFKNIKSIVRLTFTDKRPETFWNTLVPSEYGFVSNVNPRVPHPRWSQASEKDIGTRQRIPTLNLNGYEKQVGGLYKG